MALLKALTEWLGKAGVTAAKRCVVCGAGGSGVRMRVCVQCKDEYCLRCVLAASIAGTDAYKSSPTLSDGVFGKCPKCGNRLTEKQKT